MLLRRGDEINPLRYLATVADLISVRQLNASGNNRSRDRRVTEHMEIESHLMFHVKKKSLIMLLRRGT